MENDTQPTPKPITAELPHKPHHFLTTKVATLIIIFLLVSLTSLAGAVYVLKVQEDSTLPRPIDKKVTSTPAPSPKVTLQFEGQLYSSSLYHWQLYYPEGLLMREVPNDQLEQNNLEQVTFSKVGKTQKENTEFYDGLSFTVSTSLKQPNETLEQYANRVTTQYPEIATRDSFSEITVNNLSGYTAQVTGMGTFTHIFLPHQDDMNTVIWISYMSIGPDKAEYDATIKEMLRSFSISTQPSNETTMCTMEAKVCPDGSSVGRQGPKCEFEACPSN